MFKRIITLVNHSSLAGAKTIGHGAETAQQHMAMAPVLAAAMQRGNVGQAAALAYQMNGADIPRSHGYPVRAIVPGNAGARNCKVRTLALP